VKIKKKNTSLEILLTQNKKGMQGKIAEHFGYLMKKMWSGTQASISPHDFKWIIGTFLFGFLFFFFFLFLNLF
jgi:hypothetical protein